MKIVITGGAGGIGRYLVESLVKGNELFVLSRSQGSVDSLALDYPLVRCFVADVSDYSQVLSAFEEIGDFDALINCAGILGPVGSLEHNNMQEWQDTIKINLFGTVNCCKAAIPILKGKPHSKIINISGGGSAFPRLYHSAYASSKAAVVRFTENMAKDMEHDNIKIDINVVAPGAYKTKMWNDETFDSSPKEWADPSLLVDLISFLLSDKSDGISGKFFHIKDPYINLGSIISGSDLFTLRRIDDFKFKEVK